LFFLTLVLLAREAEIGIALLQSSFGQGMVDGNDTLTVFPSGALILMPFVTKSSFDILW
jgi:hypothetical protein